MSENDTIKAQAEFKSRRLINMICDNGSFVELLTYVKGKSSFGEAGGEGVISGFGLINDIQTGVFATVNEVLQGSIGKKSAKKISKLIENAIKTASPIVGFIDSEGARFAEGIKAMEGYCSMLNALSRANGKVPVILVVTGCSYGLMSYTANMCDFLLCYEKGSIASSSPLILAAKSGINTSDVGNAAVHSQKTGLITNVIKSDSDCKATVTTLLNFMLKHELSEGDDGNRICTGLTTDSTVRQIIAEAFDKNTFFEVREGCAGQIITGFARLHGYSVGVVAGNGKIDGGKLNSLAAAKISSFLITCNNFGIPVINIVDCAGAVNDLHEENGMLIREISRMLYLYNVTNMGKTALITGKAIGLGYAAFASKKFMDYSIAWDSATIGMLENEATAALLFGDLIAKSDNKEVLTEELAYSYGKDNTAADAVAESGYIDNVIQPQLTRQYLIAALQMYINKVHN